MIRTVSRTLLGRAGGIVLAGLATSVLGACGSDGIPTQPQPSTTSGTVVVRMDAGNAAFLAADVADGVLAADKPIASTDSVQKVEIFVVRIDAMTQESDSATAATNTSDEDRDRGGWTMVAEPKAKVDLVALSKGEGAVLGQRALAAGTYRSFRMIIDPAQSSVTLKSGLVLTATSQPSVMFPSASRSGIKIQLARPLTVAATTTTTPTTGGTSTGGTTTGGTSTGGTTTGGTTTGGTTTGGTSTGGTTTGGTTTGTSTAPAATLAVTFDLAQSFVVRGNSIMQNGLLFKPVVRATPK